MKFVTQSGTDVFPIGQGTWYLGEKSNLFDQECSALKAGMEAGMNLIDTAEMYGEGLAEKLVGAAIRGIDREKLYLVSKVYPFNAGRRNIFRSCENSLRRMGVDYLDLYLLHWRGSVPFAETVECMEELKQKGYIREWGVSNLDIDDMEELMRVPGAGACATDQVLYHLGSRGIEYDLLPWLQEQEIPTMAYCPLAQGGSLRRGLLSNRAVRAAAENHHAAAEQILLAWLLTHPGVVPIPRTGHAEHAIANAGAAGIHLSHEELEELDRAFPAPGRKTMLDIM